MSSSLKLLHDYNSDGSSSCTEDEETPVNEENDVECRLPLPNSLKVNHKQEVNDEPEKHDGRVRCYPHQRGNWNSLIFIPYESDASFDILCDQIIELCKPKVDLKRINDPHISLTRTFILLYHWIDSFVLSVKKSLRSFHRFDVQFDNLKVYCNEEKTRTFLAFSVGLGKLEILKSVQLLDRCLSEYKLHPFYQEASFHMSILWCLGDKKNELEELLTQINETLTINLNESFDSAFQIRNYICKIGNKIFDINLV
ncbi:hypothetical protein O3M35_011185 [Rhynocoris fuscipes]|uniref:U6 snRNA phosphodiesterase n=1 Tax=Rhynocoris fuscipes TaxID=488301 RepID=A0AAW1CVQ0_9HEMI